MKVGKRGEIYTTKEIRSLVGIKEGGKVIAYVVNGMLIIRPIPNVSEKIRRYIVSLSPNEVEEISEEMQKEVGIYG